MPAFSKSLEQAILYSLEIANSHHHRLATIEHLLLALTYEESSARVILGCGASLTDLRSSLEGFIANDLATLIEEDISTEAVPTSAYQRSVQRAAIHIQSSGRSTVLGSNLLVAIMAERESYAAHFLKSADVTRYDMVNFIAHGVSKVELESLTVERLSEFGLKFWSEVEDSAYHIQSRSKKTKKRSSEKAAKNKSTSKAEQTLVRVRIVRDFNSILFLARSLELQIKLEIERASSSKPNFQSEAERQSFEKYYSFLGEIAKGLSDLVDDLAAITSEQNERPIQKASDRVIRLRDRFTNFFHENREDAVFYCGKMPAMLGTIALFQMAGAHMITATPILMALFGGDRIAKLVKSTVSKDD